MTRTSTLYRPVLVAAVAALLAIVLLLMFISKRSFRPVALRCEYRVDPLGIDELHPRLTWRIDAAARGAHQTAYRVLVASTPGALAANAGDLWDSGPVAGDNTINIPYAGKALTSREECFWKVCVWDQAGRPHWSRSASWSMGLLHARDWTAHYISYQDPSPVWQDTQHLYLPPAHQYRKEFQVRKGIKRATVYATALGIYELHLNGKRVGDAYLAPGWTDYHQRALYNTYDVTAQIRRGANALGAWVADGWYSGYIGFGLLVGIGTEKTGRATYGKTPALMAQLEIEYDDGSRQVVATDPSWQETGQGPIQQADLLMGEEYDARKEQRGWDQPGFDASSWTHAILASTQADVPAMFYEDRDPANPAAAPQVEGHPVDLGFKRPPLLQAYAGDPVEVTQELTPVAETEPEKGVYIFNLGENIAGVVRLQVKGPAGTTIRLRYGEMLYPNGTLMTENLRKARATDYYILRGDAQGETYTPRFTYHGFQYVEVTGYPGKPPRDAITGLVLQSATPLTSGFECSDAMVNQLFRNIVRTQRSNFVDLPTDCPQRDERMGWMGDAQIYVHCATLNADVSAFYTKWLTDVMEAQRPNGVFPGYSPFPFQHGLSYGSAWDDAGVICPWTIWQAYGDTRLIKRCWPAMERFMAWRLAQAKGGYLGTSGGNAWGDWLSVGATTPLDYVDTVYFAYSSHLMSEMAQAIGQPDRARYYGELFAKIRSAFQQKYLNPDGSLRVATETAYALALYMNLVPDQLRDRTGAILASMLKDAHTPDNSGMTTGFLGTRPLLPVLTSVGQNDLAARQLQTTRYPSWGYEVAQGATSIWERWNSYTKKYGFAGADGIQNGAMNSFSHYSFGAVGEWLINDLAGIQSDGPGYRNIIIHPHPPSPGSDPERRPIDWVKAHYDSIQGRIVCNWRLRPERFEMEVVIPANSRAKVYLPTAAPATITEGGKPLRQIGIPGTAAGDGWAVLTVSAGHYHFACRPAAARVAAGSVQPRSVRRTVPLRLATR